MNTKVYVVQGQEIPFKTSWFPGGEPRVELESYEFSGKPVLIDARVRDPRDLLEVLCLKDLLTRGMAGAVHLNLPYFPGARQDRDEGGKAHLTLDIYARILGFLRFESMKVVDPHSDVLYKTMVNRGTILTIEPSWPSILRFVIKTGTEYAGIIAPDNGAKERAEAAARLLGLPCHYASKTRDSASGRLSGFQAPSVPPGHYLVVDDICDGGGTFVGLAQEFFNKNHVDGFYSLDLWVTHGIFSQGAERLIQYFSQIGTTDSFYRSFGTKLDSIITVIPQIVR